MGLAEPIAVDISLPEWVPAQAKHYIVHTEVGASIRSIAREVDCHPSTILRQVRRFETKRDDLLVDAVLKKLSNAVRRQDAALGDLSPTRFYNEAARILARLAEPDAVLAVAPDMENAVVVREDENGAPTRTAVVSTRVAEAIALNDWITCANAQRRIAKYELTPMGKTALRSLAERGLCDARDLPLSNDAGKGQRPVITESPLVALSRRRTKEGRPFLSRELVAAGERLREDFELARMKERDVDWHGFVETAPTDLDELDAKSRVAHALSELGPGLGDVALNCCCLLEGLETTERKMGWAARSGKIVLRIALQRLRRHYADLGQFREQIG